MADSKPKGAATDSGLPEDASDEYFASLASSLDQERNSRHFSMSLEDFGPEPPPEHFFPNTEPETMAAPAPAPASSAPVAVVPAASVEPELDPVSPRAAPAYKDFKFRSDTMMGLVQHEARNPRDKPSLREENKQQWAHADARDFSGFTEEQQEQALGRMKAHVLACPEYRLELAHVAPDISRAALAAAAPAAPPASGNSALSAEREPESATATAVPAAAQERPPVSVFQAKQESVAPVSVGPVPTPSAPGALARVDLQDLSKVLARASAFAQFDAPSALHGRLAIEQAAEEIAVGLAMMGVRSAAPWQADQNISERTKEVLRIEAERAAKALAALTLADAGTDIAPSTAGAVRSLATLLGPERAKALWMSISATDSRWEPMAQRETAQWKAGESLVPLKSSFPRFFTSRTAPTPGKIEPSLIGADTEAVASGAGPASIQLPALASLHTRIGSARESVQGVVQAVASAPRRAQAALGAAKDGLVGVGREKANAFRGAVGQLTLIAIDGAKARVEGAAQGTMRAIGKTIISAADRMPEPDNALKSRLAFQKRAIFWTSIGGSLAVGVAMMPAAGLIFSAVSVFAARAGFESGMEKMAQSAREGLAAIPGALTGFGERLGASRQAKASAPLLPNAPGAASMIS